MIKKREIIIAVVFFLIGLGLMYLYHIKEFKAKEDKFINFTKTCIRVKEIDDKLIDNCKQGLFDILDCQSRSVCNQDQAIQKFKEMMNENEALEQEEKKIGENSRKFQQISQ